METQKRYLVKFNPIVLFKNKTTKKEVGHVGKGNDFGFINKSKSGVPSPALRLAFFLLCQRDSEGRHYPSTSLPGGPPASLLAFPVTVSLHLRRLQFISSVGPDVPPTSGLGSASVSQDPASPWLGGNDPTLGLSVCAGGPACRGESESSRGRSR